MMRKATLVIVFVVVMILSIASAFLFSRVVDLQNQNGIRQTERDGLQDQVSQLQNQVSELQNQTDILHDLLENQTRLNRALIVNFTQEPWQNPAGLTLDKWFYVTIQNVGANDVNGSPLAFKIIGNQSALDEPFTIIGDQGALNVSSLRFIESPISVGNLLVNESKTVNVDILSGLDTFGRYSGCELVATLLLDDAILDQAEVQIASSLYK
jgi:hypothetical protein